MSLLQAVLSRSEEVVTPGGVAVCFAPQFATERLERLAPQQPQHNVNLPVSRPPGFAPKVVLVFVVHRHECHFGPPLFSVQLPRGRKKTYLLVANKLQSAGAQGTHIYVIGYPDMVNYPDVNNR